MALRPRELGGLAGPRSPRALAYARAGSLEDGAEICGAGRKRTAGVGWGGCAEAGGGGLVCQADWGQPRPHSGPPFAIHTRHLWAACPGLRVPERLPSPNEVALREEGEKPDTHSTPGVFHEQIFFRYIPQLSCEKHNCIALCVSWC